jgi:hypothetical protein
MTKREKVNGFSEWACIGHLRIDEALGMRVQWFNAWTQRRKLGTVIGISDGMVTLRMVDGHIQRSNWGMIFLPNAQCVGHGTPCTDDTVVVQTNQEENK